MAYYSLNSSPRPTLLGFGVYGRKRYYARIVGVVFVLLIALCGGMVTGRGLARLPQPSVVAAEALPPQPAPTMSAVAATPALPDDSQGLQAAINAWVKTQPSTTKWGVSVSAVDGSNTAASYNATDTFELASIYKLFLIKPLTKQLPAEAWGTTQINGRTYHDCVQAMLKLSDNPCAEAIGNSLGWSVLQRQAAQDGYKHTQLNRTDYLAGTAADTGLLLDRLYHGDGYDAVTRDIALQAMVDTRGSQAVRNACDGCEAVYNKTGDFNGVKHDAALITKNDKTYTVVIFSQNAQWYQLKDLAQTIVEYL